MFQKILCIVLSILIVGPQLSAAEEMEATLGPSYEYSADQLEVINTHGLPWQFNIVFKQVGKFRYETWYYGGTIKKKFGFVNGTKELEAAFKKPLPEEAKVIGFEPKDFSLNTKPKNLKKLLGSGNIYKGDSNYKQETHSYPAIGVAASFLNRKIDSVVTVPPLNSAARIPNYAISDFFTATVPFEDTSIQAANQEPSLTDLMTGYLVLLAGILILDAVRTFEDEDPGDDDFEEALKQYFIAKKLLDLLAPELTGRDLSQAIRDFSQTVNNQINNCQARAASRTLTCDNPTLDYFNNIKDLKSTMKKTVAKSELFPLTFHNQTNITGQECGATGTTVTVQLDGLVVASLRPGGSSAISVEGGSHAVTGCFAGSGCASGTLSVPKNANWYFYWVCNNALRVLVLSAGPSN